jgi:dTDP-glucose pyrophosphorylase
MRIIQGASAKIVLVTDESGKLVGTVTDGDIRRGLLQGAELSTDVNAVMNPDPLSVSEKETEAAASLLMSQNSIHHIPVLDDAGRVVRLITDSKLWPSAQEDAWIVIMAGGLGSRLKPLTDTTPKPLLPIGGKPLLEIIINNFVRQGFRRFFLSVNYKSEMIEEHFGNGGHLGVSIEYLSETEPLGTAGALRLLPAADGNSPVIVINGDILTNLDARFLLMFHREERAPATMCVREHSWRVPYGVVKVEPDGTYKMIEEKPMRRELISAGINVLSPEALALVPESGAIDMPALIEKIAAQLGPPAVYPVREYWLDIGRLDDLRRAQDDVSSLFLQG